MSLNNDNRGYKYINSVEAAEMMAHENDYVLLDVRTPEEFAQQHIPGAINVPNETIGAQGVPELPDKSKLVMIYCRSGRRSAIAATKLAILGYTNIVDFGGINSWQGETVSE